MRKANCLLILAAMILSVALSGCGREAVDDAARPETKFRVVTSFYPVYIATINVTRGVEGVEVVNMTKPQTGCLHDYQLTTEDMKTLEQADAFVVNGAGMEAFLDKAVNARKGLPVVNASENMQLLNVDGAENPHLWVSVTRAIEQVNNIARQLAAIDEKHAEQYLGNAAQYVEKLEALKDEMHKAVDSLPNRNIVTFHEAFPYFAEEFGLHIAAVVEREPGSEPSPRELEETVRKMKEMNVRSVFVEPQYPAGAAETISKESGAKVYVLDPVAAGEADEKAFDAYIDRMRQNAKVLQEALS